MTGNKANLTSIKEVKPDFVTFGGGEKGKIIGKRSLNVVGLPNLEDVLLVEGLIANLISISQLCDNGLKVVFDKETCSTDRELRQKFDVRSDEGIFLGYSRNSRALMMYNKRTQVVMESINVKKVDREISTIDEKDISPAVNPLVNHSPRSKVTSVKLAEDDSGIEPAARIQKNHPMASIKG
ncbi:hypothetical protein LIER_26900 [Lithospermum erythrorhizon]|uniref:Gag-pol polyprotein n=1 Tax=Lithospermum erythrorhizon TaxID=34254 RepID=A0AAV3RB96_LITER